MKKLKYQKLSDILNKHNKCPVCSKNICCELLLTLSNLAALFDDSKYKEETKTKQFSVSVEELKNLSFDNPENISISITDNTIETPKNQNWDIHIRFKLFCPNEFIGNEYQAEGSLYIKYNERTLDTKRYLGLTMLEYERFTVINACLNDETPNGSVIRILNDYNTYRTSFSIAETTLDGSKGHFDEKRILLVEDNFFKFNDPSKINARLKALLYL
jgi:hypothetical protein